MRRRGFTLIEMMTAVGLVGILAALATPTYIDTQLRAKQTEVAVNVDGIETALRLWMSEEEDEPVLNFTFNPFPVPVGPDGKQQRQWNQGLPEPLQRSWERLGYQPDGAVRCSYTVLLAAPGADDGAYIIRAVCDIDGDGFPYIYTKFGDRFEGFLPPEVYPVYTPFPDAY